MMRSDAVPTPQEFYGFKPGTDRKLIRWDRIVDYFWRLNEASNRILVEEAGRSTMDNPILVAFISSKNNLENLNGIQEMSWNIGHPGGLTKEEVDEIISEGKAVVAMTMSIHASEVGGTQVSSELAYHLLTAEDDLTKRIRENVVLVLFPCANPDGQIMTVDWYRDQKGTEYEGTGLPWLYHKYVGHDNNRDALTLTQVETQVMNRVILGEWFPQAYVDHHQMGFYGSRFFIPPNANPVNEVVDPLVWVEQKHFGSQIAIRMESGGIEGVESAAVFPADFMPGFSLVFPWFNICGMFTESASVKLATPVYVHYHQLQPHPRGRPEYRRSVNMLHPWKGGWWHLSDILEGQKTAALATLEVAANNREMILQNMYKKAMRSIRKGEEEPPYAYIIPGSQHDPLTSLKLLQTLRELTVEVEQATSPIKVGDVEYPEGSYVIFTSQTARPFLISLLSKTLYRDSPWVRSREGEPLMNYDFATQTMAKFKGVEVIEADEQPQGTFRRIEEVEFPEARVEESKTGHILDPRLNNSFKAVNLLQGEGIKIHRIHEDIEDGLIPPGAFYIPQQGDIDDVLQRVAEDAHIDFKAPMDEDFEHEPVSTLRIAMYQRYWGGNMDEGWTRWLLEQYAFPYTTVKDEEVKSGLDGYDVLILPSDATPFITGEELEEYYEERFKGRRALPKLPPEYRSGIGDEGVEKINEFIENGGTVISLNESIGFASEKLKIPVMNPLKDMKPSQFHCPGSTIHVQIDNQHPLGYGMPREGLLLLRGSRALAVKQTHDNQDYTAVATYPEENLLQSGWLIGEEHLSRKAALIEARKGEGKVILYGFQPQARALTDATFKLFFNALLG